MSTSEAEGFLKLRRLGREAPAVARHGSGRPGASAKLDAHLEALEALRESLLVSRVRDRDRVRVTVRVRVRDRVRVTVRVRV